MLDALPPEALVDDVAILGKKGAGKTYTARGEVEALLDAARRVCVIDPTGVWWGLRLAADGAAPSPYQVVVFGGDHGDVALEGASGERLAELIAGADFSCIIDTKRLTVGERTRIFTGFAERLAQVNRRPIHLVIDEAHLFAPQGRVNDPQSGRMVHAANNLVSGGRALGVRIMLLTQRPAKLHKDSLSGVETLVALRMVAPQDRAAVEDWIREQADPARGREIVASLPSLDTGEGWVWSPQIGVLERARFRPIRTLDTSRTPDDGEPELAPVRLAALDLALLQSALLPPPPADEGKNKRGSRTGAAPVLDEAEIARRVAELQRAMAADLQARFIGPLLPQLRAVAAECERLSCEFERALRQVGAQLGEASIPPTAAARARIVTGPAAASPAVPALAARLIDAMRRSPRRDLAWNEVALLAIASPISGAFRAAKNWVAASDARIVTGAAADKGRIAAADWVGADDPLIADEVIDAWRSKLGGMASEILGHLFAVGASAKDDVAFALSRSPISGAWRGAWKTLRNNQLVEDVGDGRWRLAAILRELPRAVERS